MPIIGQAQNEAELQKLISQRQYASAIHKADSLTASDSTNFNTMHLIGQAYEGLLRYRAAYDTYMHCYRMDTTNMDIQITLARTAINLGKGSEAESLPC